MSLIKKLPEGDGGALVLVDTNALNRVIDKINALIKLKVTPNGVGKLQVGDETAVLDLSGIEQYIYQLVQAANNGGAGGGAGGGGGSGGGSGGQPPGGGPGGGGGGGLPPEFENWKNNFQITAVCNGDGTITIKGG